MKRKLQQESKLIYKLVNQKISREEYVEALINQYHEEQNYPNE